jgi:hypothetical protein
MYKSRRHVGRFDLLDDNNLADYQAILNNPLCTIITERQIKKVERDYNEGQIVGSTEFIYLVVTWEERTLL